MCVKCVINSKVRLNDDDPTLHISHHHIKGTRQVFRNLYLNPQELKRLKIQLQATIAKRREVLAS